MKQQPENVFTSVYPGLSRRLINEVIVQWPSRDGLIPVPSTKVLTLWDTGADGSVISPAIVDRLGLLPSGATEVYTANGIAFQDVYDISILLPGGLLIDTEATCANLTSGQFSCLIGMDVIGRGDFAVSNFQGKTACTFRYPSIEKIDFRDGFELGETRD